MSNLFKKVLGDCCFMDDKFTDILKEFILNKVTNGNLEEFASTLVEEEQILILKKYIDKLKNKNGNIYTPREPFPGVKTNPLIAPNTPSITYSGDSKCMDELREVKHV